MNEKFPNLKGPTDEELATLAGISHDIKEDMRKYTDKEIVGLARMEKYLKSIKRNFGKNIQSSQ